MWCVRDDPWLWPGVVSRSGLFLDARIARVLGMSRRRTVAHKSVGVEHLVPNGFGLGRVSRVGVMQAVVPHRLDGFLRRFEVGHTFLHTPGSATTNAGE
jgi:hypothetical protein